MKPRAPDPPPGGEQVDRVTAELERSVRQSNDDRQTLKIAVAAAVVFHATLLAVRLPADPPPPPTNPEIRIPVPIIDVTPRPPKPLVEPHPAPQPIDQNLIHFPVPELPNRELDELPPIAHRVDEEAFAPVAPPELPPEIPPADEVPQRPEWLGIAPPVKDHDVTPLYPEPARVAGITGVVVLETRVDRDGNVRDIKVLRPGRLGMTEAAVEAVRQWHYTPTTVNGRRVEVLLTVTVAFRIARP